VNGQLPLTDELAASGADYLLHLESMVTGNVFGVREALLKAFQAGCTRGRISGLAQAQQIFREMP
jgi:hypothetical protein